MAAKEKIDLYKQHKDEYTTPKKPTLVNAGKASYLAIQGRGAPGGDEFTEKIGALYAAAYTIKMTRKFAGEQDYVVCKLEGQWWLDGADEDFSAVPSEKWNWKLMIRTPQIVGKDELHKAVSALLKKDKSPEVRNVKLESVSEGQCVQMLHIGSYDEEAKTIAEMKNFAEQQGLQFHGLHHEIYLSDPRRIPPEPVKKRKG